MLPPQSPFRRLEGWLVVLRNAVPVAGVFAFGWSADAVVLGYWFDGATALAAMVAVVMPRVLRDPTSPFGSGAAGKALGWVIGMLLGMGILGLPLWFALVALASVPILDPAIWPQVFAFTPVSLGLMTIAAGNVGETLNRGYAAMPDPVLTKHLHWEFNLLVGRVAAMLLAMFFMQRGMVLVLAPALVLFELYPLKMLNALGAPLSSEDVPPAS